jgi:phosphatidylcholine synthase
MANPSAPRAARIRAFLVHCYTASTMIVLLAATALLLDGRLTAALFVMLLSIVIDATDGTLARRFKVKQYAPAYDGRSMDDVIDYVAYVFLPVVFLLQAGMLLQPAVLFGVFPLIASAFGFSRVDAKLDDAGFFVGFPSYWNIVVAYFYLIILILSVLVFVPTRYIYITRFPRHRTFHLIGATLSGIALLAALLTAGALRNGLVIVSLIYPIYYTGLSLVLDRRVRKSTDTKGRSISYPDASALLSISPASLDRHFLAE